MAQRLRLGRKSFKLGSSNSITLAVKQFFRALTLTSTALRQGRTQEQKKAFPFLFYSPSSGEYVS